MNREELAARLETMADRMVLMASACPPIACGAILSDAKVLREAAQLIRESAPLESSRVEKVLADNGISNNPIPHGVAEWGPVCANCGGEEYRHDGFCSIECRDLRLLGAEIREALDPAQSPESPIHAASSSPSVQGEAARVGPDCHKPAPSRLIYTCDTKPLTSEKPKLESPRSVDAHPASGKPPSEPGATSPTTMDAGSEAPAPASIAATRPGSETAKCLAGEPAR